MFNQQFTNNDEDQDAALDWQQHLLHMDPTESADSFFIQQFKTRIDRDSLESSEFSSPMADSILSSQPEGQLAIDVYQTPTTVTIKAAVAGVDPGSVKISIDNDVLTIRGERSAQETENIEMHYYQECFWGRFSRSIVLPTAVEPENISAGVKNGVLTITLQRRDSATSVSTGIDYFEE